MASGIAVPERRQVRRLVAASIARRGNARCHIEMYQNSDSYEYRLRRNDAAAGAQRRSDDATRAHSGRSVARRALTGDVRDAHYASAIPRRAFQMCVSIAQSLLSIFFLVVLGSPASADTVTTCGQTVTG